MKFTVQFPQSQVKKHLDVKLGKMLQPRQRNSEDKLVPYFRAANIGWGQIDYTDIKEMWFSYNDRIEYKLCSGDMVVLEGGDAGRAAIIGEIEEFIGFQNSVHRIRPKRGENIRFAFYWMRYLKDCGYIDLVCSKATLAHFTAEKLGQSPFPSVGLDTQNAIVDFLDREITQIDQLIEKKARFIEILKEKRAALITQAVTEGVDEGFMEISKDQHGFKRDESHGFNFFTKFAKSQIKRHLDVKLGKMLQSNQQNPEDKLVSYLRAANISWGQINYTDIKKMWFSQNELIGYKLCSGDLVVLEGGDSGRAAIIGKIEKFIGFQNSVHRVRPKRNENIRFAFYWMQYLKDCGYIDLVCSKATLAHFTAEKFLQSPFPSVDLDIQNAIVDILDRETARIDDLVDRTTRSIELLKEKRSALITAAVTGKIDVENML